MTFLNEYKLMIPDIKTLFDILENPKLTKVYSKKDYIVTYIVILENKTKLQFEIERNVFIFKPPPSVKSHRNIISGEISKNNGSPKDLQSKPEKKENLNDVILKSKNLLQNMNLKPENVNSQKINKIEENVAKKLDFLSNAENNLHKKYASQQIIKNDENHSQISRNSTSNNKNDKIPKKKDFPGNWKDFNFL